MSKEISYKKNKGHQAFRLSLIIFALCTLVVTVAVSLTTYFYGFDTWVEGHNTAKPYLALWRLFLFILIMGGWRIWINRLAQWANLTPQQQELCMQSRWRFAAWLLIIEAILVQNILATLFDGL